MKTGTIASRSVLRARRRVRPSAVSPCSGSRDAIQVFIFRLGAFQGSLLFGADRPVVVGRGPAADLTLDGRIVSRRQCLLFAEDDALFIEDTESSNGTLVNRDRIAGRRRVLATDTIQIGPFSLRVRHLRGTSPAAIDGSTDDTSTIVEAILEADGTDGGGEAAVDFSSEPHGRVHDNAIRRTGIPMAKAPVTSARPTSAISQTPTAIDRGAPALACTASTCGPAREIDATEDSELGKIEIDADGEVELEDLNELIRLLDRKARGDARTSSSVAKGADVIDLTSRARKPSHTRSSGGASLEPTSANVAGFAGLEIAARVGGRLLDVAVLRHPGDEYVLGYATPQGSLAPSDAHTGLRMLRINADHTVDLVFPRDVAGTLERAGAAIPLESLTEGRPYSRVRMELFDAATISFGADASRFTYVVRFLEVPAAFLRRRSIDDR